jgi:hypothetical protein
VVLVLTGCGRIGFEVHERDDAGLQPPRDAGRDTGSDAGRVGVDARVPDAGARNDAGMIEVDAALRTDSGPPACDRENRRLTSAPSTSEAPSMVWNGVSLAVAWMDQRDGNLEIYFQRFRLDGSAIGVPMRVTDAPGGSQEPSLTWTGTEYGLAWLDVRDGNPEIYFARLDPDGAVRGEQVRLTNAAGSSLGPSLVWTGSQWGVAWYDQRAGANAEIYFELIDPAVGPQGEVRVTMDAFDTAAPSLAWTGTEYGIAWSDERVPGNYEIYFTRLAPNGERLSIEDVRVTNAAQLSQGPSLVWSGTEYGVAWEDGRDTGQEIFFARLDALGARIGPEELVSPLMGPAFGASVVHDGARYLVTWIDVRADADLYARARGAAGFGPELRLTPDVSGQFGGAFLAMPGVAVAGWADQRHGDSEVYLARICL